MPEGRMLKKVVSTSRKLANLKSDSARLLYTWLLPHLDIEGRFSANPNIVKGYVVPRLKMSKRKIGEYLEDMAINDLILLYEINGDYFLQLKKFKDFQILRKKRESKSFIPAPTKDSRITPGVPTENSSTSKVKKSKEKESKNISDDILEKEFNEFWEIYNLKVAKQDALKAFKALRRKGVSFKTIKEAMRGYANHLKNEPWKKQMHPATFLRNERWKDFIGVTHEPPL